TTVGGGVNDLLAVTGNLSIDTETLNINATAGDVANGTYKLITYAGTLSGDASAWTVGTNNASGSHIYSFSTSTAGEVDLLVAVAGPANKTWAVDADGDWATSSNWNSAGQVN